tara:strand:+ start:97 stop:246 length:150 start_codon:yes stop_codon:yes gene_type:complete
MNSTFFSSDKNTTVIVKIEQIKHKKPKISQLSLILALLKLTIRKNNENN